MMLWMVVLVTLWTNTMGQNYYKKLTVGGEEIIAETPGYPEDAPGDLKVTYNFKALDSEARIHITCPEIQLRSRTPCRDDLFYLFNGEKIFELCGSNDGFETISKSNRMTLTLTTGALGSGRVKCIAKAVTAPKTSEELWDGFLNYKSEEIDSSESGWGPAKRMTSCPCGNSNKGRIVGGKETRPNEYPFIVGVLNIDIMFLFCGATIITKRHAITAAHCTHKRTSEDKLGVLLGYHDVGPKVDYGWRTKNMTDIIRVTRWINHENYEDKFHKNDISLLLLEEDIEYTINVQPVCLPSGRVDLIDQYVKVLGWGRVSADGKMSNVLRKVNLKVLPVGVCASRFRGVATENPTQICTYGHGKDSCSGDSGGPVVWVDPETNRFTLIGLVSYGKKECGSENPAINTEVAQYLDWIQRKIDETSVGLRTCAKL